MGDHHGDTESLRRLLDDVNGETFDFAVHVGDFTNAVRQGRQAAVRQLREVEPYLERIADRTRHDLVWVYGNRDYFGDFEYDLQVGTRIPKEGCVRVGGQRFTNSPAAVESDVILVTHMETWRLLDHFNGRAHLCGNTHLGRYKGRRLNSGFLQYTHRETGEQTFGGYFVVEITETPPFDVEMRCIGNLNRFECDRHRERGVQFQSAFEECMYCADSRILMREMTASAFYGLTHGANRGTVTDRMLADAAVDLWDEPPVEFRGQFETYLDGIETDRYAPLARTGDGKLALADESYAY
ncbi:metallophosphoesterase [Halobium salinum]|uniref:Metallophosphoesterase n=1 Tax=Halobium salinum TaxID=1364940 RepID=A0ABD5PFD1_9EURY|nr:metallophosphoesterase [Halobium salinum]